MLKNPGSFIPPRYFAHAHAVALGGEITALHLAGSPRPEPFAQPIGIDGSSCALPTSGGRATNNRRDGVTFVNGWPVARFAHAHSAVSLDITKDTAFTTSRTVVSGFELGWRRPQIKIESASVSLRATNPPGDKDPTRWTFLEAPVLEVDGLDIDLLDAKEIPESYDAVKAEIGKKDGLSRFVLKDYFSDEQGRRVASTEKPPIVLHIVKSIRPRRADAKVTEHNGVYIHDLGQFHFAELVIREASRHFTLLRSSLGCPLHGGFSMGDIGQNGGGTKGFGRP